MFASTQTREMLFPVGPYTQWTEEHIACEFVLDGSLIRDGLNTVTGITTPKDSAFDGQGGECGKLPGVKPV